MIGLLGLPYEGRENFARGASLGPAHIRFWMESVEDYSPYQDETLEYQELGDLYPPLDLKGEDFLAWARKALGVWELKPPFLALGGDHLITLALCRHLKTQGLDFSVIYLDAHLDDRDEFQNEKYSHATVARRLKEDGFSVFHLGWRSAGPGEDIPEDEAILKDIEKAGSFYLSLDLDVLDPSVFPGVSNPEPGGWSFSDLMTLLMSLKGRVIAGDMVEFNPNLDTTGASGATGAVIAREMALLISGWGR